MLHLRRATLLRDASGVQAPARPVELRGFIYLLLAIWFLPIIFGLVLHHLFQIGLGPQTNLHTAEGLNGRCFNSFLSNPAVQSI
jgi:hypothetical protein